MIDNDPLWQIATRFALLSLLSIGGVNAVIPALHTQAVEVRHWMSDAEFVQLFALAQAAPGPNMLIVSLIGFKVKGIVGALVATAAMCVPSSLLTLSVTGAWHRFRTARWRVAIQRGLAPVTVGLVVSSGYVLMRAAATRPVAYLVTLSAVALAMRTHFNPLWILLAGGLVGILGIL